jgi:excisionase family DNA binding protein
MFEQVVPPRASPAMLLTISEVAAELRVDKRTVYRLLRSGELAIAVIRVGSSPRVRRVDLEAHLARLAADQDELAQLQRERSRIILAAGQRRGCI